MNPKLTLLILSTLSAAALNVFAASLYVNGTNYGAESDQTYVTPNAWTPALRVSNSGAVYSGTNINLSGTEVQNNGVLQVSHGDATAAITGGTITLSGAPVTTYRQRAVLLQHPGANLSLQDVTINVNIGGADAPITSGINISNGGRLTADNLRVDIKTENTIGAALYMDTGTGNTAHLTNSTLVSNKDYIVYMGHNATFTGSNVILHTTGGTNFMVQLVTSSTLILTDSAITADGDGQSIFNLRPNSYYTDIDPAQGIHVELINTNVTAAGDLMHTGGLGIDDVIHLTGAKEFLITGGTINIGAKLINAARDQNFIVTITDATVTNGADLLTVSDSATLQLSLNNTAVTGNITGSGTAAVEVTVSGSHSTLLSDIAQNDQAVVTVILDHNATGTGGFAGGNLITGGDSAWTFNKDSHGNYGENHGVWNIGDYEVIFDNLTHTGTVNLSVNSDTGEGGSITVTGTADGAGTVHIDTTGNGKADPNQVLPGIVSGNGTDHWQWDPIDWGIDTIIKDGDHFVKKGTSPAGAVLNSAIAVQQSMWFAQQNSLLKRMGELRYGARASRPLADKDVRVPYNSLIENIWLRSYGQQLNIGSQVAGKAYEQLIYGVDLGTDHKFTISADNDLYLGVYAGYGRSDLDYRTPGADGELNSYYGGLYATWLHSSGFYIDATFKAASVDNNLKAPYGTSQLTASYSDVNLGGSLEIGKKFTFADAWFIEPQLQVNYLHILAEDYQAGPMTISAQDLDALQLRIGSVFGRTIKLTNSGALQPYVKISGVETISSGGVIRNGYQSTRANTDGARAEVGGGLIWQLDTNNQLHLDYEASFGDKYDKPWGLTAGYRHQF